MGDFVKRVGKSGEQTPIEYDAVHAAISSAIKSTKLVGSDATKSMTDVIPNNREEYIKDYINRKIASLAGIEGDIDTVKQKIADTIAFRTGNAITGRHTVEEMEANVNKALVELFKAHGRELDFGDRAITG